MQTPPLPSESDLGTLAFVGTTAFSGTITKRYKWYRIGNLVFFSFRIEATVAGTALTQVKFDLPSTLPTPSAFSNYTDLEVAYIGAGGMQPNFNTNPGKSFFYRDVDWKVTCECGAGAGVNATAAYGSIVYVVDGFQG